MTQPSPQSGGIQTRAGDSLLVERARDFLAGGPADATTLVRRVCQLPGIRREMAERVALELLAPHREFHLAEDGRWSLRTGPVAGGEAGAPIRAVAPAAPTPAVPSFDEWRASRAVADGADPSAPAAR
ncbi:hypothetical protein PYV61_04485, partial [Roseisolibacter sp. H3M3-2]